jgi:hypothetical protein
VHQEPMIIAASVLAAALVVAAFLVYNTGNSRINTGTWVILATGDLLDFGSYFDMTGQDFAKNLVPLCFAVGSALTFVNALVKRRFTLPDGSDTAIIGIDLLIMYAWFSLETVTSTTANLAYQVTTILAFVPMYRGLVNGSEEETVLPWALWSAAYVLFVLIHALSNGPWEEGVYPVVGLITHAIVLGFALRSRTKPA